MNEVTDQNEGWSPFWKRRMWGGLFGLFVSFDICLLLYFLNIEFSWPWIFIPVTLFFALLGSWILWLVVEFAGGSLFDW